MTDKKETPPELIIMDAILRLTAIEKVLIDKNIVTKEELEVIVKDITKQVANSMLFNLKGDKKVEELLNKINNS